MITDEKVLIVVTGPTATGKTAAAIHLASALKTEIISADSRQFYKELKIGAAHPSTAELTAVPHHFIGHLSIAEDYNVSRYESDALSLLERLFTEHQTVVMVGGSGLYIHAVCHGIDSLPDPDPAFRKGLKEMVAAGRLPELILWLQQADPEYFEKVDRSNATRIIRALEVCHSTGSTYSQLLTHTAVQRPFRVRKFALSMPRELLNERINDRVDQMILNGLVEEAKGLYPMRALNALNTVGYKELFRHFDGEVSLEQAITDIKTNTRRYAKRQMTWLRRETDVTWTDGDHLMEAIAN